VTARKLKELLDKLPPEQLELTVYRFDCEYGLEILEEATYSPGVDVPGKSWLYKPEGIHLR
jgi:hypothetical protein